jgi:hypothetical protein
MKKRYGRRPSIRDLTEGYAGAPVEDLFKLKAPVDHRERDLQALMVQYFAAVVKPGDAVLFAVPNGEYRAKSTAVMLSGPAIHPDAPDDAFLVPHGQGVLHGAPDLVLLTAPTVTTLIEVKVPAEEKKPWEKRGKPRTKQSRVQEIFEAAAVRLGHLYVVVRTVDEFDAVLRGRGVQVKGVLIPRLYGLAGRPNIAPQPP